jgi:hypothetical protein
MDDVSFSETLYLSEAHMVLQQRIQALILHYLID